MQGEQCSLASHQCLIPLHLNGPPNPWLHPPAWLSPGSGVPQTLPPLPGAMWVVVSSGFVVGAVAMPDIVKSRWVNLESVCLPRLSSGRNLIPNQRKSKQILCLWGTELWKSQPLILVGVRGWQGGSSRARQCPGTADRVHWTGNLTLCNSFWTL